ncbi:MAG: UvrD-helicase domain-containing protein [Anaeroplasmataceae bacterium]|nr:UvrD-helicase domain-containing protein [Anaeroplasmataceae bacterium]
MGWTESQQQAIEKRGTNIIVSAGAGSGKTAVLSERILEFCKSGHDIRKVLVLTFTNAAAQEMKERIRQKLIGEHLFDQASLIDSAFITTFDAYSLALVKKYYYQLNIEKNIKIMDQALLMVKKQEILDMIFAQLYEEKNSRFIALLKKYAKQNDSIVQKMIFSLLSKVELVVDEKEFYQTYEEQFCSEAFYIKAVKEYEILALNAVKHLKNELYTLACLAKSDKESEDLYLLVKSLLEMKTDSYEDAYTFIFQIRFPRKKEKASLAVGEQKTICSDLLKKIKLDYFSKYLTLEEAVIELRLIKDDVLYLLTLVKELKEKLMEYKYKVMAFDYIDIAKMAIQLVKNYPNIRKEIEDSFEEILIDEYQDTSDIQEAFISLISKNNCYMVGDLKQSIYRFRNANPYIFKKKYDDYSNNINGIKIDLKSNFRSRENVIENINMIFSSLMNLEHGDADYQKEHRMQYGLKGYEQLQSSYSYDMEILSYSNDLNFSDAEVEAFICANQIKKLMDSKVMVFKKDKFVPVEYQDIAILIDKTKHFVTFKKIFDYCKIPLSIDADLDLTSSMLPKLFANILCLILGVKKEKKDISYFHALASISRSFLCSYDDTTIYGLVHGTIENELIELINTLNANAMEISLIDLFYEIVDIFQIYDKLSLIGDVNNSLVVLEYISSIFKTMQDVNMNLEEAYNYLVSVFENGIDLKYKPTSIAQNSVHIMTIHKSKGLEFPFCFFPMLSSLFNKSELKENYGMSNRYGVYIPFSDETNSNTILKALVKEELKKSDLSEKIRLFYVALTRAREKFFLISKEEEKVDRSNISSFNQMIHSLEFLKEYRTQIQLDELSLTKEYQKTKYETLEQGEERNYIDENFESPIAFRTHISKELVELTDLRLQRAIDLGKKFHECLEVLNFKEVSIEDLPIDDFMKNTLMAVLKTEPFQNIQSAKTFHEHEFYFEEYHGVIDLLCEYDDHIDIIDYKLSNVENTAYLHQLEVYKKYVASISHKPIACYLLSILKQEVKKVL